MKFTNLLDLIQVFANEYSTPGNTILILGIYDLKIKKIFEFIDSETIFVTNSKHTGDFDLTAEYTDLPFEPSSFDLILNFTEYQDFFHLLKNNGHILMQGEILNGTEYHSLDNKMYTVL